MFLINFLQKKNQLAVSTCHVRPVTFDLPRPVPDGTGPRRHRGFSLVESIVAVAIFSLIVVAVGAFQLDIFRLNNVIQSGLSAQNDARKILRPMIDELRSASESDQGAFPLVTVATSTLIFFSDVDDDGSKERIRYFLDGTDFKKGLTDNGNEKITEVVHDVVKTERIFSYYDSSYDGTNQGDYLEYPVYPSDVRLIKVELIIDENPNKEPVAIGVSTQVMIRNLKDNL